MQFGDERKQLSLVFVSRCFNRRYNWIILGFPILLIGVILMTIISSGQTWICSPHSMIVPSKSSLVHEPCALVILPILFVT